MMAKFNSEVLISEVHARHAGWREDHSDFRRKNITDKLWDEVALACDMTDSKLFQKIKTNSLLFIYSFQVVTERIFCWSILANYYYYYIRERN
jgi:hypothetical protein